MNGKLTSALNLAASGFYVLPLYENEKRPRIENWQTLATRNTQQIIEWWTKWSTANIGALADRYYDGRMVVIDLDVNQEKNGIKELEAIAERCGERIPTTLTTKTASGKGRHLFFRTGQCIEGSLGKIASGIDVKAYLGQVVAPGSIIDGRVYEFEDLSVPVALLPDWMLNLLEKTKATSKPRRSLQAACPLDADHNIARAIEFLITRAKPAIQGDHGDITTFCVAAAVKDLGISKELCFDLMAEHYNQRCQPPWKLTGRESLQTKVWNAYAHGKNDVGSNCPEAIFPPLADEDLSL